MTHSFLFFPFTHMTENQMNTILTFFSSFHYLPGSKDFKHNKTLQKLFKQGKVIPFFLSPHELEPVELKVKQYLEWAQIHRGNEVNLKSLLKANPYFTNDSDVTAIKSQIKGDIEEVLPGESILQKDLLFLKMAQLCDVQNERIDLKLKDLDTNHDQLMSTLRGVESSLSEFATDKKDSRKDSGAMMPGERICAWSRCMTAKGGLKQGVESKVFVTTSEAVFDYLESNCKDVINALDIDKIKVHENECENKDEWQHQFCDYLMRAIQVDGNRENEPPKVNDKCSLFGQIKLSLFSGDNINQVFNCSGKQIPVCLIKLK